MDTKYYYSFIRGNKLIRKEGTIKTYDYGSYKSSWFISSDKKSKNHSDVVRWDCVILDEINDKKALSIILKNGEERLREDPNGASVAFLKKLNALRAMSGK